MSNRAAYLAEYRRRNKMRLLAMAKEAWKVTIGCSKCGYNAHGTALDFHHKDPNTKEFQINARNWKLPRGQAELAKCELLCPNCHRTETAQNWRKD